MPGAQSKGSYTEGGTRRKNGQTYGETPDGRHTLKAIGQLRK